MSQGKETSFIHARTLVLYPEASEGGDRHVSKADPQLRLDEILGLAYAIELNVVDSALVKVREVTPGSYLGSGKIKELKEVIETHRVELVVMDTALSPVQQRNLEKKWKSKVIDRTGLILEIFGCRARTAEGRLQVELAALTYQRSRLVRSWTHLERQRGGLGFVGGPGETQIEVDRRLIDERILSIKKSLRKVVAMRQLHRKSRRAVPYPIVALVGYTNAGKSTLFNQLTNANVVAKDLLFATLDPTLRMVRLPSGRQIILSDTVGFISHLPTQLVAAFRATLEEVYEADFLLHVRDISHAHTDEQCRDVQDILQEMGLDQKMHTDMLEVLNKTDLLEETSSPASSFSQKRVFVSARTGAGIPALLQAIDSHLALKETTYDISVTVAEGAALSWLHTNGTILEQKVHDMNIRLKVLLSPENYQRFRSQFSVNV